MPVDRRLDAPRVSDVDALKLFPDGMRLAGNAATVLDCHPGTRHDNFCNSAVVMSVIVLCFARRRVVGRPFARSVRLNCAARSARFIEPDQADATCPVPPCKKIPLHF
jgi:hypothetical protein